MSSKILYPEKDKMLRDAINFTNHNYTREELLSFIETTIDMSLFIGMTRHRELEMQKIDRQRRQMTRDMQDERMELKTERRKFYEAKYRFKKEKNNLLTKIK